MGIVRIICFSNWKFSRPKWKPQKWKYLYHFDLHQVAVTRYMTQMIINMRTPRWESMWHSRKWSKVEQICYNSSQNGSKPISKKKALSWHVFSQFRLSVKKQSNWYHRYYKQYIRILSTRGTLWATKCFLCANDTESIQWKRKYEYVKYAQYNL